MSTITITDEQIINLRAEARAAGDDAQARLCTKALHGDDEARAACERAICDAAAMADE